MSAFSTTNSVYIVLKRDRYRRPKIARMVQKAPSLGPGEIAVKLRLKIDDGLFATYVPIIEASVQAADIITPIVEVQEHFE